MNLKKLLLLIKEGIIFLYECYCILCAEIEHLMNTFLTKYTDYNLEELNKIFQKIEEIKTFGMIIIALIGISIILIVRIHKRNHQIRTFEKVKNKYKK